MLDSEQKQTKAGCVKVAVTVAGAVTAGAVAVKSLEGSDRWGSLELRFGVKRLGAAAAAAARAADVFKSVATCPPRSASLVQTDRVNTLSQLVTGLN